MDGFRHLLEKAIRVEDDCDWSPHTIDYSLFKETLKKLARRRSRLRQMLRESKDGCISEEALQQVLGPEQPPRRLDETADTEAETETNNYIPFTEMAPSGSSDIDIDVSHDTATPAFYGGRLVDALSLSNKRKTKRSVLRRISKMERNEMVSFLTWEMDKVQMFYLSQWQRLSLRMEEMTHNTQSVDTDIGDEILELLAFCTINIVTARQILIRYDAYARTFEGTPMLDYYMKYITKSPTSFRKILYHEEVKAMADSYVERARDYSAIVIHFESQRYMFDDIFDFAQSDTHISSRAEVSDSLIHIAHHWILLGGFEDWLGLEPAYLTMRGKSLTQEMKQLGEWRKKKHEIVPKHSGQQELTGMQVYNLTLNLLSAFFYCMNYYIIEPSSTMYVNRLGAHDAMSATMIGMMPIGAFLSSLPFSMWTNKSFRHPFILSGVLLMCGNLLYSLADQWKIVHLALLGRFIAGLGAPKCIIRRYMADTTPMSLRTSVNSGFGMVVAAGSASGPAMAVFLNQFEYTVRTRVLGYITFNGLTLPGYFMAMLWFTFTLVVVLTFDEPDRDGLEDQKRIESQRRAGSPSGSVAPQASRFEEDLGTIFSGESTEMIMHNPDLHRSMSVDSNPLDRPPLSLDIPALASHQNRDDFTGKLVRMYLSITQFAELITFPVRICLGLLFAKVFTVEALVSATSALSKNRYHWQVQQVGTLGFVNGCLVIPFTILVGRLSISYQDHILMRYLVGMAIFGLFLLIDLSDLVGVPTGDYNQNHPLSVGPVRYIIGYSLSFCSIQSFEGVIGSTLSKVIPTALASGTYNSGLLATMVDTLGRSCGDLFISMMGFIDLRQLMNLLFVPAFSIMLTCLVVIERYRDLLAV